MTALVLGIIGAFLGLVPILALVAMPLGVLAVIFGLVGRAKRRPRRGMALAGAILGCVALGLGVIGVVIVGDALDELEDDIETAFNGEPAHPSEYLVDPGACAADGFTLRHEGTITNTAGRSYAFEIPVDFVDGDGVRLDQGTDYLDPLDPGQSASWTVTAFGDHDDPRCRVVEVRKRD